MTLGCVPRVTYMNIPRNDQNPIAHPIAQQPIIIPSSPIPLDRKRGLDPSRRALQWNLHMTRNDMGIIYMTISLNTSVWKSKGSWDSYYIHTYHSMCIYMYIYIYVYICKNVHIYVCVWLVCKTFVLLTSADQIESLQWCFFQRPVMPWHNMLCSQGGFSPIMNLQFWLEEIPPISG